MSIPLPNLIARVLYLSTTFLNLGHNRNCKPMPAHTEDIRCSWFITDTEALLWGKKLDNQAQGKHWLALTHPSCNIPVFSNHMKSRKRKSRRPKLLKPSQETPRFLLTFQVLKSILWKRKKSFDKWRKKSNAERVHKHNFQLGTNPIRTPRNCLTVPVV